MISRSPDKDTEKGALYAPTKRRPFSNPRLVPPRRARKVLEPSTLLHPSRCHITPAVLLLAPPIPLLYSSIQHTDRLPCPCSLSDVMGKSSFHWLLVTTTTFCDGGREGGEFGHWSGLCHLLGDGYVLGYGVDFPLLFWEGGEAARTVAVTLVCSLVNVRVLSVSFWLRTRFPSPLLPY